MIANCSQTDTHQDSRPTITYSWIEYCVRRNFGGYFGNFSPTNVFMQQLKSIKASITENVIPEKDLIQKSLSLNPIIEKYQNRYILLLTKNYAALRIIQMPGIFEGTKSAIFFGSQFPKDQEYAKICSNINRIKVHMETGTQVVLCNHDNLYASLYDVLNQNYVILGDNRYVDLGLGTHRVKCRVHPNFRLILVAEDKDVFEKFPIPLINRLEKHYLGMETIMPKKYDNTVEKIKLWTKHFSHVKVNSYIPDDRKHNQYREYEIADAFIGYHEDVIPGLICQLIQTNENMQEEEIISECKKHLLFGATPDSIMRLKDTKLTEEADEMFEWYFSNHCHDSLFHYIQSLRKSKLKRTLSEVTTHSRLIISSLMPDIADSLGISTDQITFFSLQQFGTEEEFRKETTNFFKKVDENSNSTDNVLIAQIDVDTSVSRNLVECAKYCFQELAYTTKPKSQFTVLLIIHIPRIAGGFYAGYPGPPWTSVHIDELRKPEERHPMSVKMMKGRSIYDIVKNEDEHTCGILSVQELIKTAVPRAASMLKGGNQKNQGQRINIFLKAFNSMDQFRTITMKKIVELLKKEEDSIQAPRDWLPKMSKYNESLKEGLTFRDAIWFHLVNHITISLAYILANIDCNDNLDTLEYDERLGFPMDAWRNELFLKVYRSLDIVSSFNPIDIKKANEVIIEHHGYKEFKTSLPFSWVLVSFVDACLPRIASPTDAEGVLSKGEVGRNLLYSWKFNENEMTESYLKDFIGVKLEVEGDHMLTHCNVLMDFIKLRTIENNKRTKLHSPVDFHMAYEEVKGRLTCFNAIVAKYPEIIPGRDRKGEKKKHKQIDVLAIEEIFFNMEPNFFDFNRDNKKEQWIKKVKEIQPLVEQMLNFTIIKDGIDVMHSVRTKWKQIQFLKMCLHHLIPPMSHSDIKIIVLAKIQQTFKSASFEYAITALHTTFQMLNETYSEVCKLCAAGRKNNGLFDRVVSILKPSVSDADFDYFQTSLNVFCIDFLTTFYLNSSKEPPEKEVLKELLKLVRNRQINAINSMRSCVLNVCLKNDKPLIKEHIEGYQRSSSESNNDIIEFCQVYINCVEDTILQKLTSNEEGIPKITPIIHAAEILKKYQHLSKMMGLRIENLDAAANVRFALRQVAAVLSQYLDNSNAVSMDNDRKTLLDTCVQFVSDGNNQTGANFLLKELRADRADAAKEIKKLPKYKALLPIEIQANDHQDKKHDIFLLNENPYKDIRDLLSKAKLTGDYMELSNFFNRSSNLSPNQITTAVALSIYHHVPFDSGQNTALMAFLEKHKQLFCRTPRIRAFMTAIAKKRLGWLLLSGDESQRHRDIVDLVVRMMVISFGSEKPVGFQILLNELINNPANLRHKYLPTMPHDLNFEVLNSLKLGTKYYFCPNGHIYVVGDCGQVVEEKKCFDCGATIGGTNEGKNLAAGNKAATATQDTTKPGYILQQVGNAAETVRSLTALETTVMRLTIHSALLAACVEKKDVVYNLCQPPNTYSVIRTDVVKYLIEQANGGIRNAAQELGQRSQDDIFILLHTVISRVAQSTNNAHTIPSTHAQRVTWETNFAQEIIRTSVADLDDEKKTFQNLVMEHKILHGQDEVTLEIIPHLKQLWQVRQRVTADTLLQWLRSTYRQTQAPNLVKFLEKLDVSSHLGKLPQILQLHKFLTKRFHQRVALSDMESITVADFIQTKLKQDNWPLVENLANVFLSTWNHLRAKLQQNSGQLVEQITNLPVKAFDLPLTPMNTPAAALFPSSHGTGLCSLALVRFLIDNHNQLVSDNLSPIQPVSAGSMHMAEMTREDVQLFLLTHSTTSADESSGVTKEEYDIEAIERRITDRFVTGLPRLLDSQTNLPRIQFLEDRGAENKCLKKIINQKPLDIFVQQQLETDFQNLPDLCHFLNKVLTARDFLFTTAGSPNASLLKYMKDLHLWSGYTPGAFHHLQLCHVDDLTDFLYLIRAKKMINNGENPFEQVIPMEYREKLPDMPANTWAKCFKQMSLSWLIPRLFRMIWTKLRSTGDYSPNWKLGPEWLELLLLEEDEESDEISHIPEEILVKHAVSFFYLLINEDRGFTNN